MMRPHEHLALLRRRRAHRRRRPRRARPGLCAGRRRHLRPCAGAGAPRQPDRSARGRPRHRADPPCPPHLRAPGPVAAPAVRRDRPPASRPGHQRRFAGRAALRRPRRRACRTGLAGAQPPHPRGLLPGRAAACSDGERGRQCPGHTLGPRRPRRHPESGRRPDAARPPGGGRGQPLLHPATHGRHRRAHAGLRPHRHRGPHGPRTGP
jgi:hypothetical protein